MYRYNDALVGGIEWKDIDWFRVDVIDTVELQLFIKQLVVGTEVAIIFAHMWAKFCVLSIILQVCERIVYLYCDNTFAIDNNAFIYSAYCYNFLGQVHAH